MRCITWVAVVVPVLTTTACAVLPDTEFLSERYVAQAARFADAQGAISVGIRRSSGASMQMSLALPARVCAQSHMARSCKLKAELAAICAGHIAPVQLMRLTSNFPFGIIHRQKI